ncbi:MAG TPA: ribose 5-phosphate isomerase B [Dehalococcoidia bacterium]|jgi:ribose 5-phosphate isomerase B|nr:ribose 5-phosphate isomerase B [Dehalococcoidia bacterium]
MHLAIGCDHRGFGLKEKVKGLLSGWGHSYEDFGCHDTGSVDYPDIARPVAEAVAGGNCQRGVLICSTGIGMSMSANKVRGIRAALCHNAFCARRARGHNDANVLCLGAEVVGEEELAEILEAFLTTEFEGGRHQRRLDKMSALERDP